MSFSGPGVNKLAHDQPLAQQLAGALTGGTRAARRRAEQYLRRHHIRAVRVLAEPDPTG